MSTGNGDRVGVEDLLHLRWALEPCLNPSDGRLAYVVSGPTPEHLGYDLFVVEGDGSAPGLVARGARRPRWSADGRKLAFAATIEGRSQVQCLDQEGDIRLLASPAGEVLAHEWDPLGDRLVCVVDVEHGDSAASGPFVASSPRQWSRTERKKELWQVPGDGSAPTRLAASDGNDWSPAWSRDGSSIAFISDRGLDPTLTGAVGLWRLDVSRGDVDEIVPPLGQIRSPAWSPDGRTVAYLGHDRPDSAAATFGAWTVDVSTGSRQQLAPDLDRSIGQAVRGDDERGIGPPGIAWSPDGESVLAVFADGGVSHLGRFGLDGSLALIPTGDRCVLEFAPDIDFAVVAYSWSDPLVPGEVSIVNLASGVEEFATSLNREYPGGRQLAVTRHLRILASDGAEVEGWVTLNDQDNEPRPLVLQVHGGPHYPVGLRFSFDAQRLAALGYAVLRANPRGSHGYGAGYAEGNLGDWGGRDYQDLMELVDAVISQFPINDRRLAIIGESYGGYMAAWAVTQTSRFAAAVAESPISDLVSSAAGGAGPTFWYEELKATPWEAPSLYSERSPITHIDRATTPLLLIHTEDDTTCPIAQSEALYVALDMLGRDVTFLRIPGGNHLFNVFGAIGDRLERIRRMDTFLGRHLIPRSEQSMQSSIGEDSD